MDVFVLTKGFLLDHTLHGVYPDLDAARAATGRRNGRDWAHPSETMWCYCLSTGATSSGMADEAWTIEQVEMAA